MTNKKKADSTMNFNHLYYFYITGRENAHITTAAQVLGITQPSLSSQLKIFQEDIGMDLFKKDGRTQSLTKDGETLYNYCEEMFSISDLIQTAMKNGKTVQQIKEFNKKTHATKLINDFDKSINLLVANVKNEIKNLNF